MKKIGKSKDVRFCLLMLWPTLDKAAGSSMEEKNQEGGLDCWVTMCLCACVEALSICQWLRVYTSEFMHGASNFIVKYM